jgi:bacillopeptidase F
MKRFTSIIALLLMVMGNAFAQKGTFDKIMPELLEEINGSRKSDDTYRIIIIMNEQLDSQKLTRHAQNLSKTQQREYIFNELRSTSERSQKEVLKDLQQGQKAALVDDIKSFWIINGISCSTTKEMVHAIAERPDVKYIMKDLEIHIADGEESEDIQPLVSVGGGPV